VKKTCTHWFRDVNHAVLGVLSGSDHFSLAVALPCRQSYAADMEVPSGPDRGNGPTTSHKRAVLLTIPEVTMQNNTINSREMLTASQVRELTGVPVSTLHDWAAKRERGIDAPGPHHIRLSGRHRRWAKVDVEQWIQSARV
jgi:predicted DNA-binding transcriptional regulator AlpA